MAVIKEIEERRQREKAKRLKIRAAKELIVKLGNAGVVELSYNGKLVPAFAPDTKTKTLTFTADGLSSE